MKIPSSHPRHRSLVTRQRLEKYLEDGILAHAGLIAHGRGEAFDYILGEKTQPFAKKAQRAAAAHILLARNPVISVNGNAAALAGNEIVELATAAGAKIEVNMFHWSKGRGEKIARLLRKYGAKDVLFSDEARIPGIDHARAKCSRAGIYSADVVLVPLEDGDRAQALCRMGKVVIAIDLNPLSRTARCASVTVVDELTRAVPAITAQARKLSRSGSAALQKLAGGFDNGRNLAEAVEHIGKRLQRIAASGRP